MTLRLTDEEAAALRAQAATEQRSMQEVAREAVREYIARRGREAMLAEVLEAELPRYSEALERLGQ